MRRCHLQTFHEWVALAIQALVACSYTSSTISAIQKWVRCHGDANLRTIRTWNMGCGTLCLSVIGLGVVHPLPQRQRTRQLIWRKWTLIRKTTVSSYPKVMAVECWQTSISLMVCSTFGFTIDIITWQLARVRLSFRTVFISQKHLSSLWVGEWWA